MAVNDVVADVLDNPGQFQPASGVHVVISYARATAVDTSTGGVSLRETGNTSLVAPENERMTWPLPINNSVYIRIDVPLGSNHVGVYTGVQIK